MFVLKLLEGTRMAKAQKTVLETMLEWSTGRPVWQRDALRRIVQQGRLNEEDLQQLKELCKMERGGTKGELRAIPLERIHLPAAPTAEERVALLAISDVSGVNNLMAGQILNFEPNGITVIYGDNGTGKSGYARILKRACRARFPGKIEPNVYDTQAQRLARARISFTVGGGPEKIDDWQDSPNPHAQLSAISVFDSDCAAVHIKEKNEVAFRPFGLDVPDELANACQRVKEALMEEQKGLERSRDPLFSSPPWKPSTAVGRLLSQLTPNTDLEKIRKLAKLNEEENNRLERLKSDLAKDPLKAATEQTLRADTVKRVSAKIKSIADAMTDERLHLVCAAATEARVKQKAAEVAAHASFGSESVRGIGSDVWRVLWDSARRFSTEIAYPGKSFPPSDADDIRCVLCLQPLEELAISRMARFEEFIQKDTTLQCRRAEQVATDARKALAAISANGRDIKTGLDEIGIHDKDLRQLTRRFLATARLRRYVVLRSLANDGFPKLRPSHESPQIGLSQLEEVLRSHAGELRESAGAEERKRFESEFAELQDRALLAALEVKISEEIRRLGRLSSIANCIADTATTAITKIGNDIADTVITPRMRDRFQEEIVRLAAEKVRVEIVRSGGRYGSPQYQVRLFARPEAKVQEILSEGERTCVALASFLTELSTAGHMSALVFDDPVSSLDHRWRGKVAERLVSEAMQRQVIVFTHDLVFLNDIQSRAEKQVPISFLSLGRGSTGVGHISGGLPWVAKSVQDRIDKLEKDARSAKTLYDNDQEEEYRTKATHIYSGLRASWERALEDIAFHRVIQRHRDYINTKDLAKVTALEESDSKAFSEGFKKCSDIVDAHDPSRGRNAAVPPPAEILSDIQDLRNWCDSLRARQKVIS